MSRSTIRASSVGSYAHARKSGRWRKKRQRLLPEFQPLESRVLMAFTPLVTGAGSTSGSYGVYLNTVGDQATQWTMNWGDGSSPSTYLASNQPGGVFPTNFLASHSYTSSGSYEVSATADSASSGNATTTLGLSSAFGSAIPGTSPTQYSGQATGPGDVYSDPIVVDKNPASPYFGDIYVATAQYTSVPNCLMTISRYTPAGQLDTTWGSGGTYTLPQFSSTLSALDAPYGLALSPNGSAIAVVGSTWASDWDAALLSTSGGGSITWKRDGIVNNGVARAVVFDSNGTTLDLAGDNGTQMVAARLNLSDGSLNSNFGSGTGIVTLSLPSGTTGQRADSLVQTPSGNLMLGGDTTYTVLVRSDCGYSYLQASDFTIVEMNPDGSLDTSFASGGTQRTNFQNGGSTSEDLASGIALWTDGSSGQTYVIAAGTSHNLSSGLPNIAIARYNADTGAPDANFNTSGELLGPSGDANAMTIGPAVQGSNGEILITGDTGNISVGASAANFAFNYDGSMDTSFGNGGQFDLAFGTPSNSYGYVGQAMAVSTDGSIVVAGAPGDSSGDVGLVDCLPTNRLSVGTGTISGTAFDDLNLDGVQQSGEPAAAGLGIQVTDPSGNVVGTTTTDSNGNYSFQNLPTGEQLTVDVAPPNGYVDPSQTVGPLGANGSATVGMPIERLLPAPYALTASYNSSTQISLSWTSLSFGLEQGFHIEESVDGGPFSVVASTASGVTTATLSGLSSISDYVFRVAAYDVNGDSNYSNLADAAAPAVPANAALQTELDSNNVPTATISWNASSGAQTYDIYRAIGTGTPGTLVETTTGTTWTDTSVTAGTTYSYSVVAVGALPNGWSFTPASAPSSTLTGSVPTTTNRIYVYDFVALEFADEAAANQGTESFGPLGDVKVFLPTISGYSATSSLTATWGMMMLGLGQAYGELDASETYGFNAIVTPRVNNEPGVVPKDAFGAKKNFGVSPEGHNLYLEFTGNLYICPLAGGQGGDRVALETLSGIVQTVYTPV